MYKIFSVDDHIVEPPHLWTSRVAAKHRDRAPHVVAQDGREYWVYEDQRILTVGLNAVAGRPREEWGAEPTTFAEMVPGCYDPKERAREMLSQGVLASVNFPTLPRFGGMLFSSFKDKELADVCVRAWNDFILEEWCPGGPPGLFVPMIICQVWDPVKAAAEIRRCAALGARALTFVENPVPDGLPSFHTDHWDPLWEAVQEVDMPVCLHIASSGYIPAVDPAAMMSSAIVGGNVCGMLAMINFLLTGICDRFPDLKIVWSEAGIGWIPAVLERADRQIERHQYWAGWSSTLKPSELFRRNMWACMVEEPIGLQFYEYIGVNKILAETDYPHADTPYPFVQKQYAEVFAGVPDHVVEAVSHRNAEDLFGWKMADETLLELPDASSWRLTLEMNPHAALDLRHTPSGIRQAQDSEETCRQIVGEGTYRAPCGKPVGPDGRCTSGHAA